MIALIGMPGAGKSCVGMALATLLRREFFDSDVEIEQRLGTSIKAFFATRGEPAFRDVEEQVLDELLRHRGGVLATGGGSVLRAVNRTRVTGAEMVVYLRATPRTLVGRARSEYRPLLQGGDLLGRLEQLDRERAALYEGCASCTVEVDLCTVQEAAETIAARHREQAA